MRESFSFEGVASAQADKLLPPFYSALQSSEVPDLGIASVGQLSALWSGQLLFHSAWVLASACVSRLFVSSRFAQEGFGFARPGGPVVRDQELSSLLELSFGGLDLFISKSSRPGEPVSQGTGLVAWHFRTNRHVVCPFRRVR